jgi:hypothetical protein
LFTFEVFVINYFLTGVMMNVLSAFSAVTH